MKLAIAGAVCLALLPFSASAQEDQAAREARMEALQQKISEREHVIEIHGAEMEELAAQLEANAVELIELHGGVEPQIQARIREAMVMRRRPVIGINIGAADDSGKPVRGVLVQGVTPGGPADKAGVETGDLIVKLGDAELEASNSEEAQQLLLALMSEQKAGVPLDLQLDRRGKTINIAVTPKTASVRQVRIPRAPRAPMAAQRGGFVVGSTGIDDVVIEEFDFPGMEGIAFLSGAQRYWHGIELIELTPDLGRYFGTDEGLLVLRLPEDDDLPLSEGDVIRSIDGREPKSVSQAIRILRSYDEGDRFDVEVMRDKKRRKLEVAVPDPDSQS
ncbi:MAG: PDZ domain-containing protein [Pseudomonadota bacterium]